MLQGTGGLIIVLSVILIPIAVMLGFFASQSLVLRGRPEDSEGGWYIVERVGEWPEPSAADLREYARARADGVCGVCGDPPGGWLMRQFQLECPGCDGKYCHRCRRVTLVRSSFAGRFADALFPGRVRLRCVYCLHEWSESTGGSG